MYHFNYSMHSIEYTIDDIRYIEEWKPIVGYEGKYEISDLGRIKSIGKFNIKPLILVQGIRKEGYLRVSLRKPKSLKTYNVHRLVALHFVKNVNNKKEVNHKNGIKTDNAIYNLEWATPKENIKHSFEKLGRKITSTWNAKKVICLNDNKTYNSVKLAAEQYKLDKRCVGAVCRGNANSLYGYKFKYA